MMGDEKEILNVVNGSSTSKDEPFKLKFEPRKITDHRNQTRDTILSIPKPEYQGTDFFLKEEFRGLLLADYQAAIGKKAIDIVGTLNQTSVGKFQQLQTFKESI